MKSIKIYTILYIKY